MKKPLILLLLVAILFSAANWRQNDKYFEILKNLDIFATMYKEVNANYVDDVNPNSLMEKGIDAMLNSLDPYTVYYAEDEIEDVRTENTGEYGGIGARIGERIDGGVYVLMPDEGYSAQKAGLQRGDEIIAVNNQVVEKDYDKAAQFLRGQTDEELLIKVRRPDGSEKELTLELQKVELPIVPYYGMVSDDVGLVQLSAFQQNASHEVKQAIRDLKKKGATKVILDLRGNGGGLLNEAVNISNLFIEKDELIVTTKGKLEEMNASYKTLNAVYDAEIPLAVLINSRSASASEIVAGVIQDYDRGVVVGQKSFGKGLVQRTIPLSYNSQLKVTIAKYYTPSGRCIQAIDYSNRNEDGSVGTVPDSLKTLFKTKNGRPVYEGGGVDPDFAMPARRFSPVVIGLLEQDAIFEFANTYDFVNGLLGTGNVMNLSDVHAFANWNSAKDIKITDKHFNDFKEWLRQKEVNYASPLEKELEAFKRLADETDELDKLAPQIELIEGQLKKDFEADLIRSKEEIIYLLREELAGRFFLEKGQIEASFAIDQDVQKAIEVLSSQELLKKTLAHQE